MANNNDYTKGVRLRPLHKLSNFKVSDNNLDVRGWEVVGSDGRRIGKVDDLIVDQTLMKVRYLDVDVDPNLLLPDTDDRHILVPIGAAHLDESADEVRVTGLELAGLSRYPFYRGGEVTPDYEYRVLHAVTSPTTSFMTTSSHTTPPDDQFYEQESFDDSRFYQTRRHQDDYIDQRSSAVNADMSRNMNTNVGSTSGMGSTTGTGMTGNSAIEGDIATIERLKRMLDEGTINHDEFTALKRKALGLY
ncbi:PRC-barrel domain-containing protein [Nibribacter koreensis]|uniref:PRC-barrel domain-containing protein n=1 Tax=Nibribacter koreensis TaxID=1084519 RepID=A0ABP8FUG6_9BACT